MLGVPVKSNAGVAKRRSPLVWNLAQTTAGESTRTIKNLEREKGCSFVNVQFGPSFRSFC